MAGNIDVFTDQNWGSEVLASDKPVLVDVWAEWCAPCKAMVPDLEAVAAQYAGRVRVGKINVEENEQVPYQYGITAMPTLLVFKAGKVVEQRVGKMSRDALVKLLESHLEPVPRTVRAGPWRRDSRRNAAAVAAQYAGRARVGKLNVEENDKVTFQYGITAMPTLIVFKGGKVAEQRVGRMSREALVKLVESHL